MVAQVDPNYANFSRAEQVVALIRQNSALEVKLVAYSDAHTLQQRLEEKQKEFVTVQTEVLELRSLLESERKRTIQDQGRICYNINIIVTNIYVYILYIRNLSVIAIYM